MTKEQWIRHMEEVSGLKRPSSDEGAMANEWKRAYMIHKANDPKCLVCKARRATKRATCNRKAREDAYRSAGLTKVYGAVSGKVYWE